MGREVRRVPLDFDWPLDKVWEGYLMPDHLNETPCPDCRHDGERPTGYSREADAISNTFYPHQIVHAGAWPGAHLHADRLSWCDKLGQAEVDMLVAEGRLRELRDRQPTPDNPRNWEWVTVPRTAAEVNASNRPRARQQPSYNRHLDHDGINRALLVRFRCAQLGIQLECPTCGGRAGLESYEGQRAEAEAWEPTEPPTGKGWQLWETVSEGSPISPVFPTADALAQWMSDPERGDSWVPEETARKFINDSWAPTGAVTSDRGVVSGVEYMGWTADEQ